jgi:hypothetical protein
MAATTASRARVDNKMSSESEMLPRFNRAVAGAATSSAAPTRPVTGPDTRRSTR